jgi:hypothetical protein
MNDDTIRRPEWITIDEASQLLGISSNKLLRKLQSKEKALHTGRTVSGLLVFAEDVRLEVEKRASEPSVSEAVEKPRGKKTPAGERPFISFEGSGKTYHFL